VNLCACPEAHTKFTNAALHQNRHNPLGECLLDLKIRWYKTTMRQYRLICDNALETPKYISLNAKELMLRNTNLIYAQTYIFSETRLCLTTIKEVFLEGDCHVTFHVRDHVIPNRRGWLVESHWRSRTACLTKPLGRRHGPPSNGFAEYLP